MKILQFPLVRITLAFIFGILFCQKFQPNLYLILGTVGFGLLFLVCFHFLAKKKNIYQIIFGCLTILLSFLIGISTCLFHKETLRENHYSNLIKDDATNRIVLVIHEKLKSTSKNSRYVGVVNNINYKESSGKLILNIREPNQNKTLNIGTELIINSSLNKNKNPFNPGQFDYGEYLENQEIYGQLYTNESQITYGQTKASLWSAFSNFRTKIIQNLALSGFKKEDLNMVLALLLGQQQDIAPDLLKDYQLAGAVHILSVSGLHVGFILLFVSFLLKPLANTKRNTAIKLVIILLSLWSYGILAGLAPSVIRSVTMFSFVAIGTHLRRTVNSFHTLLVSILLILLWKPSFLFDVGFQLSYLALFFILWLQPMLATIWHPKYKITEYFWNILTVSFAAQIGTMPLSIYYFHQFPGLFFLTNVIVLPMLGIIMILGLIAVIVACFGQVSFIIVKPLELFLEIQNKTITWIATFDEFVFKNISFTSAMLWLSYMIILSLILWVKRPNFKRLLVTLISIIALQIVFISVKRKTNNSSELIVFNNKKATLIAQRQNETVIIYSNDSVLSTLENNNIIQSYLTVNFCSVKEKKEIKNLIYFKGKKILLIDSSGVFSSRIKPDLVIISNSPKLNLKRLLSFYRPQQIVADGTNYKSYIRLWKATCRKEKIPFHYTNEKGFYKI